MIKACPRTSYLSYFHTTLQSKSTGMIFSQSFQSKVAKTFIANRRAYTTRLMCLLLREEKKRRRRKKQQTTNYIQLRIPTAIFVNCKEVCHAPVLPARRTRRALFPKRLRIIFPKIRLVATPSLGAQKSCELQVTLLQSFATRIHTDTTLKKICLT